MSESEYARTLSRFADRLFVTGGEDPGDEALPIEPSRLAVYHELVRRNYTSMIRFAYTMTFRLIAAEITESDPAPELPESVDAVVRRFLEVSPASNHSTRHIADVFRSLFDDEYAGLVARRPEIPDLMTLERAALGARYAFDDPGRSPDGDELAALQQSGVEEFLGLRVLRAPSAAALRLAHPATEIHHRYEHRNPVAAGELTGAERVVVTRDPRNLEPSFTVLDEGPFLALEIPSPVKIITRHAPQDSALGCTSPRSSGGDSHRARYFRSSGGDFHRARYFTVEELAVHWMEVLPPDLAAHDDAWKLATLAAAVITGLSNGYLRLA